MNASEPLCRSADDELRAEDETGGICRGGAFGLDAIGVGAGLRAFGAEVAWRNGLLDFAGVGWREACFGGVGSGEKRSTSGCGCGVVFFRRAGLTYAWELCSSTSWRVSRIAGRLSKLDGGCRCDGD